MTESIAWFLGEYVTLWAFYAFLAVLFLLVTGIVAFVKGISGEDSHVMTYGVLFILAFFVGCLLSLGIYKLFIES